MDELEASLNAAGFSRQEGPEREGDAELREQGKLEKESLVGLTAAALDAADAISAFNGYLDGTAASAKALRDEMQAATTTLVQVVALAENPGKERGQGPASVPALGLTPKTAEGAKRLYDEWAATYDEALLSWDYPAPSRVAETLAALGAGSASRILDVGCGTGLSGLALRSRGLGNAASPCTVTGVDISQASLAVAEAKGCYAATRVVNLDEPLPFPEASFDFCACAGVLSYIENFSTFWTSLRDVLRPGGIAVCTHREVLWDEDDRSCRSAADELDGWRLELCGEPEPYMPGNPDSSESVKRIRILALRRTLPDEVERPGTSLHAGP